MVPSEKGRIPKLLHEASMLFFIDGDSMFLLGIYLEVHTVSQLRRTLTHVDKTQKNNIDTRRHNPEEQHRHKASQPRRTTSTHGVKTQKNIDTWRHNPEEQHRHMASQPRRTTSTLGVTT
jgi:hypothetical protein